MVSYRATKNKSYIFLKYNSRNVQFKSHTEARRDIQTFCGNEFKICQSRNRQDAAKLQMKIMW